jgi:glutathione S-transferase
VLQVYGDLNSGNCLKVKWVCDLLARPYTWIDVDVLAGGTRSEAFLSLNSAGQVPVVVTEDGRGLAQSNAIIRYLARDSDLIPRDLFDQAKMDEWLFWEQYSHEPFIAVCRYVMVYLGKPASARDPDRVRRGEVALARMERHLTASAFLVGDAISLADVALLAYTRVAPQGGFDLSSLPNLRRWIAGSERALRIA